MESPSREAVFRGLPWIGLGANARSDAIIFGMVWSSAIGITLRYGLLQRCGWRDARADSRAFCRGALVFCDVLGMALRVGPGPKPV